MRLTLIFSKRDISFPTTITFSIYALRNRNSSSNEQCSGLEARLLSPYN